MACNHERIKSVNCVLFCADCGAELPADYLTIKHPSEPVKAAETPAEGQKRTRKRKVAE